MIPLSVSEISALDAFVTDEDVQQDEELSILVVGFVFQGCISYTPLSAVTLSPSPHPSLPASCI